MTVYGNPRTLVLTGPQVAKVAQDAGWRGDNLVTAVAIAKAESGWDAHSVGDINLTTDGEQSTGLWQINYRPRRDSLETARQPLANMDPAVNARNAYGISGGGVNFRPWSTFNSGAFKQYLDQARAAVAGVSGAPILSSTTATGAGTVETVLTPLPDSPPISYDVQDLIVGGSVDLTTSKVSELTLEIVDTDLALLTKGDFALGYAFTYEGISWTVVSLGVAPYRGDIPKLIIHAHPTGVYRMRLATPSSTNNISPTSYLRQIAGLAGLGFVGQDSPVLAQIGPTQIPDTAPDAVAGAQKQESAWDVGVRLGKDLAKTQPWVMFEAGGTLFFGVPQYLANHNRNVELTFNGSTRGEPGSDSVPMLTLPSCEATRTQTIGRSIIPRGVHINATVDRAGRRRIRPGQRLSQTGVPVFDGNYMVTHVRWDVLPVPGLVTVEATDFPAIPGVGEIGTLIPVTGPQTVDPNPPSSGSYFQQPRLNDSERIRLFGQPGDTARLVSYRTPWGITVQVNNAIISQFQAACVRAKASSTYVPLQIGSIRVEKIPGSSSWSLHAFGLAWDFFNSPPGAPLPGGPVSSIAAPDPAFRDAFKSLGFYLGAEFHHTGGFGNSHDYPHIEWASAPPSREQVKSAAPYVPSGKPEHPGSF